MNRKNIWLYTTIEVLIVVVAILYLELNEKGETTTVATVPVLNTASKSSSERGLVPSLEFHLPVPQSVRVRGDYISLNCIRIKIDICDSSEKSMVSLDSIRDPLLYRNVVSNITEAIANSCRINACDKIQLILVVDAKRAKNLLTVDDYLQVQKLAGQVATGLKVKSPMIDASVVLRHIERG